MIQFQSQSYANDATAREAEIPNQMSRLASNLEGCMDAFKSLEARLSPVTRAEPPTTASTSERPQLVSGASTSYGATLAEMVKTAAALNANIGSLLTRIEV